MSIRYAVIDGCPCPRPMYPLLRKLKKETGCTFNSIYRGDDVAAILHRHGKHTQRELFDELPPGVANPPDRGSHILLGDGVVGKLHEKLPWWRCGIDVDDDQVHEVIAAAAELGWDLYQPYPSGTEYHHLNFRKKPSRWKAFFRNVFGKTKPKKKKPASPKVAPANQVKGGPQKQVDAKPKPKPVKHADHLGAAIDVSEAQGDVDWAKVGGAVKVAFCKATEGTTFTDSRFNRARLKEMQAHVRAGVYHFARPDNNGPTIEVKHFVSTVHAAGGKFISYEDWKAGKPGIVGVLDFETSPYSLQWVIAWGEAFEKETGVKALLYGYGSSLNPVLGALKHFAGIWFAAYVADWKPYLAAHHDRVVFWQDSSTSRCAGVSGDVDHSKYLGKDH